MNLSRCIAVFFTACGALLLDPVGVAQSVDVSRSAATVQVPVHRTLVPLFVQTPAGEPATGLDLRPEDLKVLVAGRRVATDPAAGCSLDVFCDEQEDVASLQPRDIRHLIVVVDFNFMDAAARFRVADAIDAAAAQPSGDGVVYSVLVIASRVIPLTPGFVPAGRRLHRAASALRELQFEAQGPKAATKARWSSPLDRSFQAEFRQVYLAAFFEWMGKSCVQMMLPEFEEARKRGVPVLASQESESRPESAVGYVAEGIAPKGTLSQREASGFLGGSSTGRGPGFGSSATPMGFLNDTAAADHVGDVVVGTDIGPSVRALSAIVQAYAQVRSPKWLVLFSGEAFRSSRDAKNDAAVAVLREAAALRFTVWTVDAAGIGRSEAGASELLAAMARDSGGAVVRGTNDLATVFRRVERSSACYAILALPPSALPGDRVWTFDVAIDTARRPDLWGYTVAAPRVLRPAAPDRERQAALRQAQDSSGALSSIALEGGFVWPDSGNAGAGVGLYVLVEPVAASGSTESLLDLAVAIEQEADGSVRSVSCGEKTAGASTRLRVRGGQPLLAEFRCQAPGRGRYTAHVTVVAPEEGRVGARTFSLELPSGDLGSRLAIAHSAMLASPCDAVTWSAAGPAEAGTAGARRVVVPAGDEFSARCEAEVLVVLCGEDRLAASDRAFVTIARWDAERRTAEPAAIVPSSSLRRAAVADIPGCVAVRAGIPPYSLEPGNYAWMAEAASRGPSEPAMVLAAGLFAVR
jgi:hypothetical protein